MARAYSNENVPAPVVAALRALGHDVLTSLEAGNANAGVGDVSVLAFAYAQGRVTITGNQRHFVALHRQADPHCGIICYKFDNDFERLTRVIHEALSHPHARGRFLAKVNQAGCTVTGPSNSPDDASADQEPTPER